MSDAPATRSIPVSEQHRWRAYWVCVAVAALTIMDLSKVNVGLPAIEEAFDAGSTELQLIVAGYVLTFGLTLVPAGRIGDQRSRKTLFIVGLSLFTLTSIVAALAPNATVLLIARLVQGVAAGIQMPQVLGLIQELFRGKERGKAFGLFGATIGLATAFGPTLGGLMIAIGGPEDGWRGIFWINVPLALIAIVLAVWLLPLTRHPSDKPLSLDPVGIVLFGVSVLSLMWPFLFTTGSPDDDPSRWWVLVIFVFAFTAFLVWERRYAASGRHPLVPLNLFGISSYRNGTALSSVYFAALPPMFLLTTLYLQHGLGLAAVFAGMVTIGFALVSALTSYIGGNLVNRFGRPLVVWGLVLIIVGVGLSVLAAYATPPEMTPWAIAVAMTIAGAGGGFVISPNQTLALADIPVKQGGLAGSVGQLGQRIGTAIGTAITLSLFYSTIYRESSGAPGLSVYRDAYAVGMIAVAVLVAVSFAIGVLDLGARGRQRSALGGAPAEDLD